MFKRKDTVTRQEFELLKDSIAGVAEKLRILTEALGAGQESTLARIRPYNWKPAVKEVRDLRKEFVLLLDYLKVGVSETPAVTSIQPVKENKK